MKIRILRRPKAEVGHANDSLAVLEIRLDFVLPVKDQHRLSTYTLNLDLHLADAPVSRTDIGAGVGERKPDPMEEAAERVEVVVGHEELHPLGIEPVLECGEKRVRAGGERTCLKFELAPRQRDETELLAIDAELPAKPHAVDDEPGVVDGTFEREGATVESRALLHQPLRHRVKDARDGNLVRRREVRLRRIFERGLVRKRELPCSVQVEVRPRGERSGKQKSNRRCN